MWRLHSPDRWSADAFVYYSGWPRRGKTDYDDRGPGNKWQAASPSGSFHQGRRDAMRILHFGNDHVGECAALQESKAESRRDHYWHERKHLSLRNLPAN